MNNSDRIEKLKDSDLFTDGVVSQYIKDLEVFDAKIVYNEKIKGEELDKKLDSFNTKGLDISDLLC